MTWKLCKINKVRLKRQAGFQQCSWRPLWSVNKQHCALAERREKLGRALTQIFTLSGDDRIRHLKRHTEYLKQRKCEMKKLSFTWRKTFKAEWICIRSFQLSDAGSRQLFGCFTHLSAFHAIVYFKKVSIKVQLQLLK